MPKPPKPLRKKMKPTVRQQRFIREYVKDFNATQAAIRAGYSKKGATVQGYRLLVLPHISDEIALLRNDLVEKMDISAERVLLEIARVAFVDPRKLFNDDKTLKDISELDDDTVAAISGFKMEGTVPKDIKMWDKNQALEKLAKFLDMYQEQSVSQTVQIVYNESESDLL